MGDEWLTLDDSIGEFVGDDPDCLDEFENAGNKIEAGRAVTALREKLQLNEKQFAKILGVSEKKVLRIEYGDFDEPPEIVMKKIWTKVQDWLGFIKKSRVSEDIRAVNRGSAL